MDKINNFKPSSNTFAVYTTLRVILEMRRKNGLEAAIEYMAAYCRNVERELPVLKSAVDATLKITDVKFIHDHVTKGGDA